MERISVYLGPLIQQFDQTWSKLMASATCDSQPDIGILLAELLDVFKRLKLFVINPGMNPEMS